VSVAIACGDLFWVDSDESRGSVPHPHVVISDDALNQSRLDTVVVCALTSNLQRATEPGNVRLALGEGNLAKESVVIVSQVSSMAKSALGARIGALSKERVAQILSGLRFQQASFFERRTEADSSTIPVLQTERLILRPHRMDDLESCVATWAHPDVVRYTIGQPSSAQKTWLRILGYLGHWPLMGYGYWAIEERTTGRYVGELGFADFKRDIGTPWQDVPEAGWALTPSVWGKGYATEGMRAALAWADANVQSKTMTCLIHPENKASANVAGKCGFIKHTTIVLDGHPEDLYVRNRP
jgi:RimJ/RimL family protein N-acetyltransferase/mRNA-degrading endonuclease toxin of MazEF toxin-antitoxin module